MVVGGGRLVDGSSVPARCVVTAIDPGVALLELLEPVLTGTVADRLRVAHRGNAVQTLVLLAVDRQPPFPGARRGDHAGLQSFVDALDPLVDGFAQAEAGHLPADPVPTYLFTPSALDPTVAPPGRHTVYLACPCAPARVAGGWGAAREAFAERMIDTVQARGPRVPELDRRPGDPDTGRHGRRAPVAGRAPDAPGRDPRPARPAAADPGARRPPHPGGRPVRQRGRHRAGRRHFGSARSSRSPGGVALVAVGTALNYGHTAERSDLIRAGW